jgi:hypothetical protein
MLPLSAEQIYPGKHTWLARVGIRSGGGLDLRRRRLRDRRTPAPAKSKRRDEARALGPGPPFPKKRETTEEPGCRSARDRET